MRHQLKQVYNSIILIMKIKHLFIALMAIVSTLQAAQAQSLETIRTYHDPWTGSRLFEIYTVIAGTGTKHGSYKQYDEDGDLYMECNYVRNQLHGEYKLYRIYDTNGILRDKKAVGELSHYENGVLHGMSTTWCADLKGKRHMLSRCRYEKGKKMEREEWYYEGNKQNELVLNGVSKTWRSDGTLEQEWQVTNGRRNGYAKFYNEAGIIISEQTYTNDELKTEKFLYENGNLKSSATYDKGQLTGTYMSYYPDGSVESENSYSKPGLLSKRTKYASNGNKTREIELVDIQKQRYSLIAYDSISGTKSLEAIQGFYEVANERNDGYSGKVYYPDGRTYTWVLDEKMHKYKERFFRADGTLEYVNESNGDRINYSDDGAYKTSKVFAKSSYHGKEQYTPYELYYPSGNVSERGYIDTDDNVVEKTYYEENGTKSSEYVDDRYVVEYYPDGKILEIVDFETPFTVGYEQNGTIRYVANRKSEQIVYFYPNGDIRAKGVQDKDGNRIGKWYIYSPSKQTILGFIPGKLSIEENGVSRKPTKEEKTEHESYLSDLINYRTKITEKGRSLYESVSNEVQRKEYDKFYQQ